MDNKKPGHVREAYRHWLRLFGPPKRMALDLGREFRGAFAEQQNKTELLSTPRQLRLHINEASLNVMEKPLSTSSRRPWTPSAVPT